MSKHLPTLIDFAQREMPSLEYDCQNASTPSSQRDCLLRLQKIVAYLLHDAILNQSAGATSAPAASSPAPRPAAPPAPPATRLPNVPGVPRLPPPTSAGAIQPILPAASGIPADAPIQAGVTNVVITAQGTHVTTPGGQHSVIPPHQPVPVEVTTDQPSEPPPAPEGTEQVVLPRGGGMTPDVMAALAGRSSEPPPSE